MTSTVKQPADPRWQSRRWQLYYQSRGEYIAYLYSCIRFAKRMMNFWEQFGRSHPALADDCIPLIKFEREDAQSYQTELRKVVGR